MEPTNSGPDRANLLNSQGAHRLARTRHGFMFYLKNGRFSHQALAKYGESQEATVQLMQQVCQPGQVALDIGANIGLFAVPLAKMVGAEGRIIAFEPQQEIFQILCANLVVNGVLNAKVYQTGVSSQDGVMYVPELDYTQTFNFGGVALSDAKAGPKVQVVTIDGFLQLERCDFIKIDVEGMEMQALEGASETIARFRPFMLVENDRLPKSPKLIRYLWELKYRLHWFRSPFFNPDNIVGETENIVPYASVDMFCVPEERSVNVHGSKPVESADEHPLNT